MHLKYIIQRGHNSLINCVISFMFFGIATISFAVPSQSAGDELVQLLNNIHTMQASFRQVMVNKAGIPVGQKTIGLMMLERPGKFRWEVTQPNKQLIIINADKFLLYDIDLVQVTRRKMDYKNFGNPAMLLSGNTQVLQRMFNIVKLQKSGDKIWFELRPKKKNTTDQNSNCQWIKMYFVSGKLSAIYILDGLGQKSEINFSGVGLNSKIRQDKFTFVIPPKVDVLDE